MRSSSPRSSVQESMPLARYSDEAPWSESGGGMRACTAKTRTIGGERHTPVAALGTAPDRPWDSSECRLVKRSPTSPSQLVGWKQYGTKRSIMWSMNHIEAFSLRDSPNLGLVWRFPDAR